nr:uncharacterized protein LOC105857492 [Microcebus murinus]
MCSVWNPWDIRDRPLCHPRLQALQGPNPYLDLPPLAGTWRRLAILSFELVPMDPPTLRSQLWSCSHVTPSPSLDSSLGTCPLHRFSLLPSAAPFHPWKGELQAVPLWRLSLTWSEILAWPLTSQAISDRKLEQRRQIQPEPRGLCFAGQEKATARFLVCPSARRAPGHRPELLNAHHAGSTWKWLKALKWNSRPPSSAPKPQKLGFLSSQLEPPLCTNWKTVLWEMGHLY